MCPSSCASSPLSEVSFASSTSSDDENPFGSYTFDEIANVFIRPLEQKLRLPTNYNLRTKEDYEEYYKKLLRQINFGATLVERLTSTPPSQLAFSRMSPPAARKFLEELNKLYVKATSSDAPKSGSVRFV